MLCCFFFSIAASECFALFFCLPRKIIKKIGTPPPEENASFFLSTGSGTEREREKRPRLPTPPNAKHTQNGEIYRDGPVNRQETRSRPQTPLTHWRHSQARDREKETLSRQLHPSTALPHPHTHAQAQEGFFLLSKSHSRTKKLSMMLSLTFFFFGHFFFLVCGGWEFKRAAVT